MSVQAIQPIKKGKSGGGGLGSLLGTVVGGVGGFLVGGPGGALAGASLGQSVGGGLGNAVDPATADEQQQGVQGSDDGGPMTRKLKSGELQNQMSVLKDAAMAVTELPPEQRQEKLDPIMQAAAMISPNRKA